MAWNTALVTGASSGIGREIVLQLARAGTNVVLVARSTDALTELASTVTSACGVTAEVLPADLTTQAGLDRVARRLRDPANPVDLLVNNAGVGTVGPVARLPLERETEVVRLNAVAVLHLSRVAAKAMQSRSHGSILNMGSLAGFAPVPYFAVYSATKAFVLQLTLALREELRGSGVSVTVIAPGFVDTDFGDKAGVRNPPLRRLYASAERVARDGLAGAARGRAVVTPGLPVRAGSVFARVSPPAVYARMMGTFARALGDNLVEQSAANASTAPSGPPPDETIYFDDTSERPVGG